MFLKGVFVHSRRRFQGWGDCPESHSALMSSGTGTRLMSGSAVQALEFAVRLCLL